MRLPQATVASIYVPNGGKDFAAKMRFLEAMDAYAAEFAAAGEPLVLCGDLNVTRTDMDVHPKERKPRAIGQLPEERALLERIIGRGLVDVQRTLHPDDAELFTWWAPWRNMRQRNIGWRLDYVLASSALAGRAESCVVQREFGTSDHGPVIAVFDGIEQVGQVAVGGSGEHAAGEAYRPDLPTCPPAYLLPRRSTRPRRAPRRRRGD